MLCAHWNLGYHVTHSGKSIDARSPTCSFYQNDRTRTETRAKGDPVLGAHLACLICCFTGLCFSVAGQWASVAAQRHTCDASFPPAPAGIGRNTQIKGAVIENNVSIGADVTIRNVANVKEADRSESGGYIIQVLRFTDRFLNCSPFPA